MQFESTLDSVGELVWQASWQAAFLASLVWGLCRAAGTRIAPRWRFVLWSLVFLRLALPVVPASPTSIFCLWQTPTVATGGTPALPDQAMANTDSPMPAAVHDDGMGGAEAQGGKPAAEIEPRPILRPTAPAPALLRLGTSRAWAQGAAVVWLIGVLIFGARRVMQQRLLARQVRRWRP